LGISIHQIIDVVRNVLQHFGNLAFWLVDYSWYMSV
jgi:hypothetical protein